jgi:rare lipoprotein A
MNVCSHRLLKRASAFFVISCCAAVLAACGSQSSQTSAKNESTTEYFAESEWGVKASPRISSQASGLPRGGGRDHLGRPYQIRGQWYHPRKDPDYRAVGMASWYGSAFHGRLTANGEVYDMMHLTAAHPTMPLPSYARVTNLDNGTSLVVRVNDRGPFVGGRIIDLSRRSAELLGTKGNGVAKVEVEYLGRAPLHGQDEQFLLASYSPGGRGPDPSDGLPSGVMLAMNGASPTAPPPGVAPRPPAAPDSTDRVTPAAFSGEGAHPVMPERGPIIPQRPYVLAAAQAGHATAERFGMLSYADSRISAATAALDAFADPAEPRNEIVAAWQRDSRERAQARWADGVHVALGTFASLEEAEAMARAMQERGEVEIVPASGGMASVLVVPDGRADIDAILRAAWQAGAADAMTVRR